MFYTLIIENGHGVGCHIYPSKPDTLPANEAACTQAQSLIPGLWDVVSGKLVASAQGTKDAANAAIIAQIDAIEKTQARAIRESALSITGSAARVKAIDDQIAALRAKLQ